MSEILSIHLGQAGVQIGESYWELLFKDHSIDNMAKMKKRSEKMNHMVNFTERKNGTFCPRAIFVDLDPGVINEVKKGYLGRCSVSDSFISFRESASDCFTRGYQTIGFEILEPCLDSVRRLVEECESFGGFMFTHSVSGGTGSGFCSILTSKLKEEYPRRTFFGGTVYQSPGISTFPVCSYNAVLSICLVEDFDLDVLFDNESLYRVLGSSGMLQPTFKDINRLIALSLCSLTSSLRNIDSELRTSLNDIQTNLVAYPKMHFVVPSICPILPKELEQEEYPTTVSEITKMSFHKDSLLLSCDLEKGKYISAGLNYFGEDISPSEVSKSLEEEIRKNKDIQFVEWMPSTTFKVSISNRLPPFIIPETMGLRTTEKFLSTFMNNTSVRFVFDRVHENFGRMYCKQAFAHNYTWYLSREEFSLPGEVLLELIYDYKDVEKT